MFGRGPLRGPFFYEPSDELVGGSAAVLGAGCSEVRLRRPMADPQYSCGALGRLAVRHQHQDLALSCCEQQRFPPL